MDLEAALWIAAAFAVGAYGGASTVPYLPEPTLHLLFGFLLIVVGMRSVFAALPEANFSGMTALALAFFAARVGGPRQFGGLLAGWRPAASTTDSGPTTDRVV